MHNVWDRQKFQRDWTVTDLIYSFTKCVCTFKWKRSYSEWFLICTLFGIVNKPHSTCLFWNLSDFVGQNPSRIHKCTYLGQNPSRMHKCTYLGHNPHRIHKCTYLGHNPHRIYSRTPMDTSMYHWPSLHHSNTGPEIKDNTFLAYPTRISRFSPVLDISVWHQGTRAWWRQYIVGAEPNISWSKMYLFKRKIDNAYSSLNTMVEGSVCKKKNLYIYNGCSVRTENSVITRKTVTSIGTSQALKILIYFNQLT